MRIPAIRGKMGDWLYYVSTMSFLQVSNMVKKVDDELHKTEALSDMIQRSITENVNSIKDYLLNQHERFFNSLVLAIYDGEPEWIEVEYTFPSESDITYFGMGFLEFNGEEKIFPVDGQHRVEAIKQAVHENQDLREEKISVIFIGHSNNSQGMERSRRLFSTLNRYAKPVKLSEIISLDEDDIAAITTRYLVENYSLFMGKRTAISKGTNIPNNNYQSLTTLEALYKCTIYILQSHTRLRNKKLKDYLRYRKDDAVIDGFKNYCQEFWNAFSNNLDIVNRYQQMDVENVRDDFRNKRTGGIIFFRPIGLMPFVDAINSIKQIRDISFNEIIRGFNHIPLDLNELPWKNILWDPASKTMRRPEHSLIKYMLIYFFDKSILNPNEIAKMNSLYMKRIGTETTATEAIDGLDQA
ncbi:MAG: DNA sulfur modification protein DndB [Candidatus Margulisbacteria bacterium]|nr:DNA sulfur modification protein DndB [Candidatus Margulisiibacteriota bacterium]